MVGEGTALGKRFPLFQTSYDFEGRSPFCGQSLTCSQKAQLGISLAFMMVAPAPYSLQWVSTAAPPSRAGQEQLFTFQQGRRGQRGPFSQGRGPNPLFPARSRQVGGMNHHLKLTLSGPRSPLRSKAQVSPGVP